MLPVWVTLPRAELYRRIDARVDDMVERGLEAETKSLQHLRHLNALQTVGYQEFFDHFDGKYDLPQTIHRIKQNTRHYAKRQETWFKKYFPGKPFDPGDVEGIGAAFKFSS